MKRENIVVGLVALSFVYPLYNYSITFHRVFSTNSISRLGADYWFVFGLFLTGIVSLVLYYTSGYKRSQLLRAYLVYAVAGYFFDLFTGIFRLRMADDVTDVNQRIVIDLMYVAVSSYSLYILNLKRTFALPANVTNASEPVDKGIRLLNGLLDLLLFGCLIFSYYGYWEYLFPRMFRSNEFNFQVVYMIGILYFFVYYLVMEYFFRTTFGKVITNTTVVHKKGEYASFLVILVRTLSRFIPLDVISFLLGEGWHDQISKTQVVRETDRI